jgi:hypothetical protein
MRNTRRCDRHTNNPSKYPQLRSICSPNSILYRICNSMQSSLSLIKPEVICTKCNHFPLEAETNDFISKVCFYCRSRSLCIHSRPKDKCRRCKIEKSSATIINADCSKLSSPNTIIHAPEHNHNRCIHKNSPTKARKCVHNHVRYTCRECKGPGICIHGMRKVMCKMCGGSQLCSHDRQKSKCGECKKTKCKHGTSRTSCHECVNTVPRK